MTDRFTKDDIQHIARLARLQLDDEQIEQYRLQLGAVLEHVQMLSQLDLDGVEPLSHPIELNNRLNDDSPQASLQLDDVLRNAPQLEGQFLAVPRILGESEDA